MYDYVDRRLTQLEPGSRFLVWSMRLWVTAIGIGQCPTPAVAPAFARWRAFGALAPFMKAMALLNRDALETFHFSPVACEQVSEHEAIVLSVARAMSESRFGEASETLALIVAPDALGELVEALAALVATIAPMGLSVARCQSAGTTSTE
jgi:hypothetical protein